ncbi:lysophospholipid acyltransferase family protein [Histidinibacterium lentulum]|uniref:Lauroyl acyltransferase n=1 Tax=Histidinibacterium lentulum TaxID=2480588 RepID=A0A3N2R4U7_9RHOB|nr:lysophospholipid acyltransferase family protein [Histidinibacterium lentulum]ROU02366.1 lauroyl acyltransferase [Histidinibacterium lentulum]
MPAKPRSRSGRLAAALTYGLFRATLAVFSLLPFRRRVAAFGWLMAHGLGRLAGYRARIMANLALVHPDMPLADRRALATQALDTMGRMVMENFCPAEFGRSLEGTPLEGPGLADLAEASAQGRPVLFVSAHFGNHEAPRHLLSQRGHRIGGIYRPFTNPRFDADYRRTIASLGGAVFPQGREGTVGFSRYLREGGLGILFYDVRDPRGEDIPFMGRPALTATSAAKLALKYDAALIPWFGIRKPDGHGFRCVLEAEIPHTDPTTMTRDLHRRLEARIAETPEQWFWVHRRWKPRKAQARQLR